MLKHLSGRHCSRSKFASGLQLAQPPPHMTSEQPSLPLSIAGDTTLMHTIPQPPIQAICTEAPSCRGCGLENSHPEDITLILPHILRAFSSLHHLTCWTLRLWLALICRHKHLVSRTPAILSDSVHLPVVPFCMDCIYWLSKTVMRASTVVHILITSHKSAYTQPVGLRCVASVVQVQLLAAACFSAIQCGLAQG